MDRAKHYYVSSATRAGKEVRWASSEDDEDDDAFALFWALYDDV